MRVIGIDPGLRRTGWGVLDARAGRLTHVASGVCEGRGELLSDRLLAIFDGLSAVLARFAPDAAAVEKTFVNKDAAGTLKLGQARGIALLAPARAGLAGRRIRAERGQEGDRRRRPRRQGRRSPTWSRSCSPARRSAGPTPRTRWPSPSATPTTSSSGGRLAAALARAEARA
jgi:hypothetical protein